MHLTLSHDAVIDVLQSCIKAFTIINGCLDEDYSNVLKWLNRELAQVWEDRGAFPGLGAMLHALGISQGIIVAKQVQEQLRAGEDMWSRLDAVLTTPETCLDHELAKAVTPIIQKTWKHMPKERKDLFRLLSRFSLTIDQAFALFDEDERKKQNIHYNDREIIENPYIIYEKTRLKQDNLYISVRRVDRRCFW